MEHACSVCPGRTTLVDERIECNDCPMESRGLSVLARQAQWSLDEMAFDLGAGRSTPEQREALASDLTCLARALRAYGDEPMIIDATDSI